MEVIAWDKNKSPHAIQLKDKNRLVVGILNHIERKHDHQKPEIKFLMPDETNQKIFSYFTQKWKEFKNIKNINKK